jgi:leucyl-tRNA synthetase
VLLKLLAPFAPHIVEELWEGESSIHLESWPVFDSEKAKDEKINFVIQVNGKLKGTFEVDSGLREDDAMSLVKEDSKFKDLEIKKVIFVPDRLINLVV